MSIVEQQRARRKLKKASLRARQGMPPVDLPEPPEIPSIPAVTQQIEMVFVDLITANANAMASIAEAPVGEVRRLITQVMRDARDRSLKAQKEIVQLLKGMQEQYEMDVEHVMMGALPQRAPIAVARNRPTSVLTYPCKHRGERAAETENVDLDVCKNAAVFHCDHPENTGGEWAKRGYCTVQSVCSNPNVWLCRRCKHREEPEEKGVPSPSQSG